MVSTDQIETPDHEALGEWLHSVQRYPVTRVNAQRIAKVLHSALLAQAAAAPDSLFWTEPANLVTTLARYSNEHVGDD